MIDLYLFRATLRDLLRAKRLLMALLLAAMPAGIALIWRATASARTFDPVAVYNTISAGLVFGFILVLLTAVFGTGVISQEVEQKTIVYLLTRPVPRWRILLAKFLAALLVILLTAWLAATALTIAAYGLKGLSAHVYRRDLLILPVGGLAYGAVFLLLATVLQRPLLWGLLFTFGWETWVPNLPGSFKKASLMSYLRVLSPHPAPESEMVDLSELLSLLNPVKIPNRLAWEVLAIVAVVALTGALILFSKREYVPRDDAE
jgi:ABC-2 type transport system permease protein